MICKQEALTNQLACRTGCSLLVMLVGDKSGYLRYPRRRTSLAQTEPATLGRLNSVIVGRLDLNFNRKCLATAALARQRVDTFGKAHARGGPLLELM